MQIVQKIIVRKLAAWSFSSINKYMLELTFSDQDFTGVCFILLLKTYIFHTYVAHAVCSFPYEKHGFGKNPFFHKYIWVELPTISNR